MGEIKEIFKKEMARIIKDKKTAFSIFLLPVLIMVGIMSLMNTMIGSMQDDIEKHHSIVYIRNNQSSFQQFLNEGKKAGYEIRLIDTEKECADAKEEILNGEADLIIEFPAQMDEKIQNYKVGDEVPQVKTYYNPSENYSSAAYAESAEMLEAYRQTLLAQRVGNLEQITVFTVNSDNKEAIVQDEDKATGKALGMMLPYFITIMLFAGAMSIGTDMIAGEKERGTMASLLVSPIKRSSIVLGKVFALMALSGISSMIYVVVMVGFMPSMSKSMMGESGEAALNINLSASQIAMLAVLLVGVAFLYSAIIALISVFAKTVKEAGSYVTPAYMLVLIVGMMTMFSTGKPDSSQFYIPVYNISLALQGILSRELTMMQYGVTVMMTFGIGALLVAVMVKAFESEKVMAA